MKKRWIFVIVIFAAILSAPKLKAFFEKMRHSTQASLEQQHDKTLGISNEHGFGKYLKSARSGYRATFEKDDGIPKECLNFFDELQRIDFFSEGKNIEHFTYQLLPQSPEGCRGELIRGFTNAHDEFLKNCSPKDQNLSEHLSRECEHAVFMLRAAVTRLALKDKAIKDINDLSQLTDLMFSELTGVFNESKSGPAFGRLKDISQKMLELDPKLFAAHKMNVTSNLIEGFMSKQSNQDASDSWKNAEEALKKAYELRPNDEMLNDAAIAVQTKGFDPELTKQVADKMTHENPEQDRGWYLLSYSQWKQGDRASSITNLKRAISLAPSNLDYPGILEEITSASANEDSFKTAFKIEIDDGDFNH